MTIDLGQRGQHDGGWEMLAPSERPRLVRLCARITGDPEAADDLAQETLLEAWRHAHLLHDHEGRWFWLAAIARNVCRRWTRAHVREQSHRLLPLHDDNAGSTLEDAAIDACDVEREVERGELAHMLDRALALLPVDTRRALVARYIEELPHTEVAERLGLSEGAVAMRLQRGKLALRRTLTTDLRAEAAAYGMALGDRGREGWADTRLWCPECGHRRLLGRFVTDRPDTALTLRCPACFLVSDTIYTHGQGRQLFAGVKGYKPALSRIQVWSHSFYRQGLTRRAIACPSCGRMTPMLRHLPAAPLVPLSQQHRRGAYMYCPLCDTANWTTLPHLALSLPEGQRFWRTHPRIRTLPEREVEAQGRPAIITAFESVTDASTFVIVSDHETYAVLSIHGAPDA